MGPIDVQRTLQKPVTFDGHGLHSGSAARMVLHPSAANTGIVFRRTDLSPAINMLPARFDHVTVSPLNTRLENEFGTSISTIEHIMAALAGCGVHNALICVDGPEVPIMDGSARAFVRRIVEAGIDEQPVPLRAIQMLETVRVIEGDRRASLAPATGLQISFAIDFTDAAIGRQSKTLNMANGSFVRELADSRTFCRASDIDMMRAQGKALGGTLENAVVVDGAQVLTPGGLRHSDEAVRHKMLDALGDLYTAGAPILGRFEAERGGHALTNALLRKVFSQPQSWKWVTCDAGTAARLPGVGVTKADLVAVA